MKSRHAQHAISEDEQLRLYAYVLGNIPHRYRERAGRLPDKEASYATIEPNLPVGNYEITVDDVPVDAFWSISVYNKAGFFEKNDNGVCSVNSVTAQRNEDGSTTVRFGDGDLPNTIPIMDGWNYAVRLYRPRKQILDGIWTFPEVSTAH